MRKVIISGLMFIASTVFAQSFSLDKKVVCDKLNRVLPILVGKFNEQPIWLGVDDNSKHILFVNAENKTWTLVQLNDETACIIDSGTGFQITKDFFNKPV